MDRRERSADLQESLMMAFKGHQATVWTALPGVLDKIDLIKQTCSVQPTIQSKIWNPPGSKPPFEWKKLPLLLDCPIVFPNGGGFALTFPVAVGDECLVIFSSRCIDAWWQQSGIQPQVELRMHDLSDGFALVGPRSVPRAYPTFSTTAVQLRSYDGLTHVEIDAAGKVNLTAPAETTVTAPVITLNGNVVVNGTVTATGVIHSNVEVSAQTTPLHTHYHISNHGGPNVTTGPLP